MKKLWKIQQADIYLMDGPIGSVPKYSIDKFYGTSAELQRILELLVEQEKSATHG